jgi:uncharacterized protein
MVTGRQFNRLSPFARMVAIMGMLILCLPLASVYAAEDGKPLIYDEAGLLDAEQEAKLTEMARTYGAERETDIIIYTSLNESGADVMKMTEDFYDNKAPGYDKPHGNAVILTMDMKFREVYLAGFYKGQEYLDDGRLDRIRNRITSDLSAGDYYAAFSDYIVTAHRYMGYKPGVDPDNILFKWWFQVGAAGVVALLIVWRMVANSGGKVTVHSRTYENVGSSGVIGHRDQYIRTTVTKQHIPKPSSGGGGGGGGGGRSSGGHSHSGSRGSF